jgi:hypothetical protein
VHGLRHHSSFVCATMMEGKGGNGEEAKQRGNEAFKKGLYAEAVGEYTEAILSDSLNHVFHLNRSMAYMKLSK